jgi:hypothetical protein
MSVSLYLALWEIGSADNKVAATPSPDYHGQEVTSCTPVMKNFFQYDFSLIATYAGIFASQYCAENKRHCATNNSDKQWLGWENMRE